MIYLTKEFAMIKITAVDPQDLPALLRIERLGFNEAEAGTAAQYQARINQLADTFLAARDADQLGRRSARWLYRRSSR
ncbi:hypothetical protein ACLOBS_07855 [Limosilactobacillus mucosae]|uniref:hypothetical protein n=1 Tax=Limosilactobacillus mucosae TaxID=97478 RepID=UPI003EC001E9